MKTLGLIFLAAGFDDQVQRARQGPAFNTRDLLIVATIALALGFAIILWVFLRSRKKTDEQDQQRLAQMTRGQARTEGGGNSENGDGDGDRQRRRKRRRRRDHRPRNPPLSQTGGLPPPRPDDQLPKY